MRNSIITIIITLGIYTLGLLTPIPIHTHLKTDTVYIDTAQRIMIDTLPDWEVFRWAIIETESECDSLAVGKTNDLGYYQITPTYVYDVNRILGYDKYAHKDALLGSKSHEMFDVVQLHYNPEKSFKKALMKHNPNAVNANYMRPYEVEVMYHYYKTKYKQLIKQL